MDLSPFASGLARIRLPEAGAAYWLASAQSPEKAKAAYEDGSYAEHPDSWYDPRVVMVAVNNQVPAESCAYICLTFLAKIAPDPDVITGWPTMKKHLARVEQSTAFAGPMDQILPVNPDFLEKFANQNDGALESWVLQQVHGAIWLHFKHILRIAQRTSPAFRELSAPHDALLNRLVTPETPEAAEMPGPKGTLILSSHFRFDNQHMRLSRLRFQERFFVLTGPQVNSEAAVNIMPMLMLKALNKGKAVYVAIDGGSGNLNREVSVFGIKVPLPSSFIWVAWKQKCACEWGYVVAHKERAGTQLQAQTLSLPDLDYETFCDVFLHQLGMQIETAMLRHPFSFGTFRQVWRQLREPIALATPK